MAILQRVIEQRVNALGVSEPNVYTVTGLGIGSESAAHRLVVELAGGNGYRRGNEGNRRDAVS